jgi:hypothetical protein
MKVNGAWCIEALPTAIVVELEDNSLKFTDMTPFREISEKELKEYKGYHPRKVKGQPIPDYLYRFYGIEKSDESATEVIHIRMTPTEKAKVDAAAKNADKTVSEFMRDYIRSL